MKKFILTFAVVCVLTSCNFCGGKNEAPKSNDNDSIEKVDTTQVDTATEVGPTVDNAE